MQRRANTKHSPGPGDLRLALLHQLYGSGATELTDAIDEMLGTLRRPQVKHEAVSEHDAWIIAYPDHLSAGDASPLATLRRFTADVLAPDISGVHTLPIHPASGDGGFSVVSYDEVDTAFGSWDDIQALAASTRWTADAVVNHVSSRSDWFRGYLSRNPEYRRFFRELAEGTDVSAVVRPRTSPLMTPFTLDNGSTSHLWTTFSADQVDLDFRQPEVLLAVIEMLLRYVSAGAGAIRLDAVAYIWKDPSTPSINLPETHAVVQLLRAILDEIDPGILLVTETNVPHDQNITYFGPSNRRESQAIYQFCLPPLVLHSFTSGSTGALKDWLRDLRFPARDRWFLNVLASHDGVGLRPVEDILDEEQTTALATLTRASGGVVNSYESGTGSQPYELAGSWFSLVGHGHSEGDAQRRHVASHALILALRGVPLIYFNSLFGRGNDVDLFAASGHGRDLNRGRYRLGDLTAQLARPNSRASGVWKSLSAMLRLRRQSRAFHPDAAQAVLDSGDDSIVVHRRADTGSNTSTEAVVAVNVSGRGTRVSLPNGSWRDSSGELVDGTVGIDRWSSRWLYRDLAQ